MKQVPGQETRQARRLWAGLPSWNCGVVFSTIESKKSSRRLLIYEIVTQISPNQSIFMAWGAHAPSHVAAGAPAGRFFRPIYNCFLNGGPNWI